MWVVLQMGLGIGMLISVGARVKVVLCIAAVFVCSGQARTGQLPTVTSIELTSSDPHSNFPNLRGGSSFLPLISEMEQKIGALLAAAAESRRSHSTETPAHELISMSTLKESLHNCWQFKDRDPRSMGWDMIANEIDVQVYRKKAQGKKEFEYLVRGSLPDVSPETCLHSNIDEHLRHKWDTTLANMRLLQSRANSELVYCRCRFPWPFKDREYVYARRHESFPEPVESPHSSGPKDKKCIMLVSQATRDPYPSSNDAVRVYSYWAQSLFYGREGLKNPGVEFITMYSENSGCPVPANVMAYMTSKVLPQCMHRMHAAAAQVQQPATPPSAAD